MKFRRFSPNPRIPYKDVVKRLRLLPWGKLRCLGLISEYPILMWQHSPTQPFKKVFISAGIHGDEPSGVECVLRLLENRPPWLLGFKLTVFPCLNPWGYEYNTRTNPYGKDVNRQWKKSVCREVTFVRRALQNKRFDLSIGLHEDYDATGFYIYELIRNGPHFGRTMIRRVSPIIPIEHRQKIEGRRANHGVVTRSIDSIRRRRHWPEACYQMIHHTDHNLTLETPTSLPIKKRIRAHLEGIRAALRLL